MEWGSRCRTCGGAGGAAAVWGAGGAARLLRAAALRAARRDRLPGLLCRPCLRHLRTAAAFNRNCLRVRRLLLRELAAKEFGRAGADDDSTPRSANPSDPEREDAKVKKCKKEKPAAPIAVSSPKVRILPRLTPRVEPVSNSTVLLIERPHLESAGMSDILISKNATTLTSNDATISPAARFCGSQPVYSCKKCNKNFISERCLQVHAEQYHYEILPVKNCSTCGIAFENTGELTRHNLEVHFPSIDPTGKATCGLCKKVYKNKYLLARHKKKVHAREEEAVKFFCSKCKRGFAGISDLLIHGKTVNCDGKFIASNPVLERAHCGVCDRKFENSEDLENHMKFHILYDCNFCSKGFLKEDFLMSHLMKHTENDNLHGCEICNKLFTNGEDLQKHKYVAHKIDKDLKFCGHCSVGGFDDVVKLLKHIQSAHSDDAFLNDVEYSVADDNVCELILQTPADAEHSYLSLDPEGIEKSIGNDLLMTEENRMSEKDKYIMVDCIEDNSTTNMFHSQIEELVENLDDECYVEETVLVKNENENRLTGVLNESVVNFKENFTNVIDDVILNRSDHNSIMREVLKSDLDSIGKSNISDKNESILNSLNIGENNFEETDLLSDRKDSKEFESIERKTLGEMLDDCNNSLDKNVISNTVKRKYKINRTDEQLQCKVCSKKFLRIFNLQKHMFIHNNEPPHCVGCGFESADQNSLKQHLRQCCMLRSSGNLTCTECGKVLTTAAGLRYHLQAHAGIRKHVCSLCQRRFLTSGNLKSHLRTIHSRLRPYKCMLCTRAFSTRDHLRKHNAGVHTCQRDHVCCSCGQRFKQSSHLTQHMYIHTGAKPHSCKYCTNKYSTKGSLTKHLRRNHLEQQNHTSMTEIQSEKEDCEITANLQSNTTALEDGIVLLDDDFTDGVNVVIIVEDRDIQDYEKL